MPTEENQNVQTGGNPTTGDTSNADNIVDTNIDIDLNLDGLDIPADVDVKPVIEPIVQEDIIEYVKSNDIDTEKAVAEDGNDRLIEEDQKVEELQKKEIQPEIEVSVSDTVEDTVVDEVIQDENIDETVESLMEAPVDDISEEVKLEEINTDIDFVDKKTVVEDVKIDSVVNSEFEENKIVDVVEDDNNLEELKELEPIIDITNEEQKQEVDILEETKPEEIKDQLVNTDDIVEDSTVEDNAVEDSIVENNQLDLDNLDFESTNEKIEEIKSEEIKDQAVSTDEIVENNVVEDNAVEDSIVENNQLDLDNLDFESTNEKIEETKPEEIKDQAVSTEEIVEDSTVEGNQLDVISDTDDIDNNKDNYVPNDQNFDEVTEALNNTDHGGAVDLGSLGTNNDVSQKLEVGVEKEIKSEGVLDLDSMIKDLGNTDGLNAEETVILSEPETTKIEVKPAEITANMPSNPVEAVVDNNISNVSEQTVVSSQSIHTKNTHTGLKIFLFVIFLFVGLVFILSKMYPAEFKDAMTAIKGGNTTVVEYSDNANIEAVLDETENNDAVVVGDIEDIDVLDPDSLAGQLGNDDQMGEIVDNVVEPVEAELIDDAGHDATEVTGTDFNAFEGLDDIMDTVVEENVNLLQLLRDYKEKGSEYNVWGRAINNTTAMKYGSYISKKAGESIVDIENGVKIDTVKVNDYFAQFDIYLTKLEKLRVSIDGESTTDFTGQVQDDALVSTGIDESNTESTTGTVQ